MYLYIFYIYCASFRYLGKQTYNGSAKEHTKFYVTRL